MLKSLFTLFFSLVIFASPVFAKPDLVLNLEGKKIIMEKGKEKLVDAKEGKPGDVILYTLTIKNKGDSSAINVQPIGDVPDKTVFFQQKINVGADTKVLYSIDDGNTYSEKPMITVNKNGKVEKAPAPYDMYKKIKWILKGKIDPGKTTSLSYRVKVK